MELDNIAPVLERVWLANEAYTQIRQARASGAEPPAEVEHQFLSNIDALPAAHAALVDKVSAQAELQTYTDDLPVALYDSLAESERGENEETIVYYALCRLSQSAEDATVSTSEIPADEQPHAPARKSAYRHGLELKEKSDNDLCTLAKEGDKEALSLLISRHKGFLWQQARRRAYAYRYNAIDADDLFQEGALAVMQTAETQDDAQDIQFFSRAASKVRQQMTRYIDNHASAVRVPINQRKRLKRIDAFNQARLSRRRPILSREEISQLLNIPVEGTFESTTADLYRRIPLLTTYMGSLERGYSPQSDSSPGNDYVLDERSVQTNVAGQDDKLLEESALKFCIRDALTRVMLDLTTRERDVLELRFGLSGEPPKTLEEMGKEFNVSRERIRQIESKALAKLRHPLRSQHLRGLADDQ
jgi:RNA polymerase sigma factor (sigma-70 family)